MEQVFWTMKINSSSGIYKTIYNNDSYLYIIMVVT